MTTTFIFIILLVNIFHLITTFGLYILLGLKDYHYNNEVDFPDNIIIFLLFLVKVCVMIKSTRYNSFFFNDHLSLLSMNETS